MLMDDSVEHGATFRKMMVDDPMALGIITDVVSLSLDVPVRLLPVDIVDHFYASAQSSSERFRHFFPDIADFRRWLADFPEDLVKGIASLRTESAMWEDVIPHFETSDLWLTPQTSNFDPLHAAFNRHRVWHAWEMLWLMQALSKLPANGVLVFPGGHWQMAVTAVPCLKALAVVGPAWVPSGISSGSAMQDARIKPHIDQFLHALEDCKLDYQRSLLERFGNWRHAMSRADIAERAVSFARTANQFLLARVPSGVQLRRCDLIGFGQWAAFITQYVGAKPLRIRQKNALFFRSDHAIVDDQPNQAAWILTYTTLSSGELCLPHFEILPTRRVDESEPRIGLKGDLALTREGIRVVDAVDAAFSRFRYDNSSRVQRARHENLNIIREWLSDHFGVLTALSGIAAQWDERVRKVSQNIAERVARLTNADYCNIYRYDYGNGCLTSLYYVGSEKEVLAKQMETVAGTPDSRERSLSYRAFDKEETQFCRSFDAQTGKAEPDGQTLIAVPEGYKSGCSGISTPIAMFGRPWGVLEIIGFRQYQFRFETQGQIEEYCSVITPFYYHQWFLANLHGLNALAVSGSSSTLRTKYDGICRHLALIFLADSAVLWLPDREVSTHFVCSGWHNRPDLDGAAARDEIHRFNRNDLTTKSAKAMKNGDLWWQDCIGKGELSGEWLEKAFTCGLRELGRRTVCLIPVRDADGKVVASLSLFSNSANIYDDRWQPLVVFVTRYLALLMASINSQANWETRARHIIAHEMLSAVGSITDTATRLEPMTRRLIQAQNDSAALSDYELWLGDLNKYTRILRKKMVALSNENIFAALQDDEENIKLARERMHDVVDMDLRKEFNAIFQSRRDELRARKIGVIPLPPWEDDPVIRMNEENFFDILGNIASNAIKYSATGGVISSSLLMMREGSVVLNVKNLGRPIAGIEERKIFNMNQRGSNAEGIAGDGIGLYLVKGIAELYQIGIRYKQLESDRPGYVWHSFFLSFPKRLLIRGCQ
jgi:signal transduction histidine kinase